jgi:hypothetical protein
LFYGKQGLSVSEKYVTEEALMEEDEIDAGFLHMVSE